MVKRYDQHDRHEAIEEMANGDYVRHEDYAALAERCERLEADARRYRWIKSQGSVSREVWSVWEDDALINRTFWSFDMNDDYPAYGGHGLIEVDLDSAIDDILSESNGDKA